jgi:hypothetical protein
MKWVLTLFLLLVIPCIAQNPLAVTGNAETTGSCSPAVTGNNNKFTITCQNVPGKLRDQFVDILNRLAKNESDAVAILAKLDGCMKGVNEVREQQQPWHLTNEQKKRIGDALGRTPAGTANVSVHAVPSDRNASLMGIDILQILTPLNWVRGGLVSDFTLNPQLIGVYIVFKNPNLMQAMVLVTTFREAGINAVGMVDTEGHLVQGDNDIAIAIGAKPIEIKSKTVPPQ